MEQAVKKKISETFALALISSIIFLITIAYSNTLWSSLWVLALIPLLLSFGFFVTGFVFSGFFIKNHGKKFALSYVPLLINTFTLALTLALPLNKIRERFTFVIYKPAYELATNLVLSNEKKYSKYPKIHELPDWYGFLSVGGGEVLVINQHDAKSVFFYTFRGTPDGKAGFLKIKQGKLEDHRKHFLGVGILTPLGDDWYYITVG